MSRYNGDPERLEDLQARTSALEEMVRQLQHQRTQRWPRSPSTSPPAVKQERGSPTKASQRPPTMPAARGTSRTGRTTDRQSRSISKWSLRPRRNAMVRGTAIDARRRPRRAPGRVRYPKAEPRAPDRRDPTKRTVAGGGGAGGGEDAALNNLKPRTRVSLLLCRVIG